MSRRTGLILGALLFAGALGCGIATALTWQDAFIEGAYLNRSVGAPAYSATFSAEYNNTAHLLLGAAIGLAVAAVAVAALTLRQSARRVAPPPPAPASGRAP